MIGTEEKRDSKGCYYRKSVGEKDDNSENKGYKSLYFVSKVVEITVVGFWGGQSLRREKTKSFTD